MKPTIIAALVAATLTVTPASTARAAERTIWLGPGEIHTLIGVDARIRLIDDRRDFILVECVGSKGVEKRPRAERRFSECHGGDFVMFERSHDFGDLVVKKRTKRSITIKFAENG